MKPNWRDVPGWWDDGDASGYRWILSQVPVGGRFVEVGTYCGRSLCAAADVIKDRRLRFIAVDPFDGFKLHIGPFLKEWESNVGKFGLRTCGSPLVGESVVAARIFDSWGKKFDAVFIDGLHDYESVLADVRAWYPLVKPGGVIGGHDYNRDPSKGHVGVKKAVDEFFFGAHTLKLFESGAVWAYVKGKEASR